MKAQTLYWKVDTKSLFDEIRENGGHAVRICDKLLTIMYNIMRSAAAYAIELQDEKMIAYMARLGLYEACSPTHKEHKKIMKLMDKYFNDNVLPADTLRTDKP